MRTLSVSRDLRPGRLGQDLLEDCTGRHRILVVVLGLHVALWTLYSLLAQSSGTVHHDMTEAYAWGLAPQLGYYKHPPVYAWMAGAWFLIFPRSNLSFYLLSQVSSAIGLAGVWAVAGRLLQPNAQMAAVLLTTLAPFHNIMAINFNANSGLLPLWPWTAYAFVRVMETGKATHGAALGLLAAASVLCKYYSILLLVALALAALASPRFMAIVRSPAPAIAALTFLLAIAPHSHWLSKHDWQTFSYASHTAGHDADVVWHKTVTTALACLGLLGVPLLVWLASYRRTAITLLATALRQSLGRETAWLAILAAAPFAFTLAVGRLASIKISTNFLIPAFSLVFVALFWLSQAPVSAALLRGIALAALAYPIIMNLAAPVIATAQFERQINLVAEPRRELARHVTKLWREAFDRPLALVAGSNAYGSGLAFYSKDAPAEFIRLSYAYAPWVTPERLERHGIAVACTVEDQDCLLSGAALMTPASQRHDASLAHTFRNEEGASQDFTIFLIAPGPMPAPRPFLSHRAARLDRALRAPK